MGVSSSGMSEADYTRFTHTFTLALATTLYELNPSMTFNYVSGMGTDSSEKGRSMWARVKGKTENDVLKLGFQQAFMFRPGMIVPEKGVQASAKLYRFFFKYLTWLVKLMKKLAPKSVVDTIQIGHAMINITRNGYEKTIIDPVDIQVLAAQK